jgi:hypothetical protein
MPIEDVDYLKKHSRKEAYTFLIDSADRDKETYPTPSSYVVSFTTPLKNVVGLEILDASIPRTQYNIDLQNNTLAFMIHDITLMNNPFNCNLYRFKYVSIEPGDYSIQTLIPQLNNILIDYVQTLNTNIPVANLFQGSITASPVSNPPDIKNTIKFTCPYPFVFDMANSSMAETLGFDTFTQSDERLKPPTQQRYVRYDNLWSSNLPAPDNAVNRQLYHSVDLDPSVQLGELSLFTGPRGVLSSVPISVGTVVSQSFTVPTNHVYLSNVSAAFVGSGTVAWGIYPDVGGQPGAFSQCVANGTIAIYQTDGTLSPSEDVPKQPPALLQNGKYWISFTTTRTSANVGLLYNDLPTTTELLQTKGADGQWYSVMMGDIKATATVEITTANEYHTLVAPGSYNLIGERYIILRCPEIEDHSFRSLAYSNHFMGLAMFRLGTQLNGLSDNNVSHVKVPIRTFHPIGKLPRLTMFFQTINGQTYDFKGVNHTITVAVYYLEPHNNAPFERSIINPNYTGDYMQYILSQEDKEGDSDDQDESYDRDILMNYRTQEARHLPDTIDRLDREALFRAHIEEQQG